MNKIALIGPRSVGKSTIAKELQKILNIDLIDFDNYSEEKLKSYGGIQGCIEEEGWDKYYEIVHNLFREFLKKYNENHILDIGGLGIVSDIDKSYRENGFLLKKLSTK